MPNYEVKNVKTFRGMEGQGFNATLYRDGKRVAFVIDEGCGGCLLFEWEQGHGNVAQRGDGTDEAKVLRDYAATLPAVTDTGMMLDPATPFTYQPDSEHVVNELVTDYLQRRDLTRILKRVVIKLPDNKPGELTIVGGATFKPTPEHLAGIEKQYPQAIMVNRLPFDEALRVYRGEA